MEKLLAALCGVVYSLLSWGFVIYKFWYWLLIPIFPVKEISYWEAVSINMILILFNRGRSIYKDKKGEEKEIDWTLSILVPWVSLLVGYLVSLFL